MNAIAQASFVRTPQSNTPLFEALVCETHHAAAMSTIVANCINGSTKGIHRLDRTKIDRFLPPEPAVLLSLTRRSLLEIEPLSETQDVVDAFFVALRVMRRALESYFYDAAEIGDGRARVIHARSLSLVAGRVCHEGLRAVRALETETPGRLPDLYCQHAQALSRLLIETECGGTPCLDAAGDPFFPKLPQRRHSSRRTLGQSCRVLYRKAIVSAFAKDISEGGIGLLRAPYLRADDVVTVELGSGRRFKGIVAWTRGEAAGVRFFEVLNASDPVLAI
ncbi:MAG: PilZ domain-containing protein [Hyphomicrobiaceae bacterium]